MVKIDISDSQYLSWLFQFKLLAIQLDVYVSYKGQQT